MFCAAVLNQTVDCSYIHVFSSQQGLSLLVSNLSLNGCSVKVGRMLQRKYYSTLRVQQQQQQIQLKYQLV